MIRKITYFSYFSKDVKLKGSSRVISLPAYPRVLEKIRSWSAINRGEQVFVLTSNLVYFMVIYKKKAYIIYLEEISKSKGNLRVAQK